MACVVFRPDLDHVAVLRFYLTKIAGLHDVNGYILRPTSKNQWSSKKQTGRIDDKKQAYRRSLCELGIGGSQTLQVESKKLLTIFFERIIAIGAVCRLFRFLQVLVV